MDDGSEVLNQLLEFKARLGYRWWRLKRALRSALSSVNETPILVLGNQKSGTTAIAVLLAERAGLSATLDIEVMTASDERNMHRREHGLEDFVASHKLEFSRDLIKEPRLTFLYSSLRERFPDAKYVFIVRDPRDNLRSILNRLNLPGNREQLQDTHYDNVSPAWKLVIDGRWMGLTGKNYIDMLAERWRRAAQIYLNHEESFSLIRYEDFIADKEVAITDLAKRLGRVPKNDIGDKVDVQYQPQGNRSISWNKFFGNENLRRIEDRCLDLMESLGYKPQIL